LEHIKEAGKNTKSIIDFKNEAIQAWKMISDEEIKGRSLGSFTIANGIGMSLHLLNLRYLAFYSLFASQ
jgi:hypothetical protein